jgi:hypothetical protein
VVVGLLAALVLWALSYELVRAGDVVPLPGSARAAVDTLALGASRPFRHAQHTDLSCVECHTSEETPGVVTIQAPRDCTACHHDPTRAYSCDACHASEALAIPRDVVAKMTLTVWGSDPRTRTLPFDHGLHGGVECRDCHTAPITHAVGVACAACHQDHHRPQATCSTCHLPAPPGVHGLEVHLTCAGAGCHGGSAGERPTLTRELCLTCHVDRTDHEPGLSCQQCHMIPEELPARPPVRTGASGWHHLITSAGP